jgi:hypothetical protein
MIIQIPRELYVAILMQKILLVRIRKHNMFRLLTSILERDKVKGYEIQQVEQIQDKKNNDVFL